MKESEGVFKEGDDPLVSGMTLAGKDLLVGIVG